MSEAQDGGGRTRRPAEDRADLRAAAGVRRRGERLGPGGLRAGRRRSRGVVGLLGGEARVDRAVVGGARLVGPAVREVVRRREAERLGQLPRPSRRRGERGAGRLLLGGRGRDPARGHLRRAAGDDAAVRQRAQGPRHRQGRRGRDLPADAPRDGRGDARVRAHRRDPQRRLRGLLGGVGPRADGVLRREGARHRRRHPAPRRADPDEGEGGRRPRRDADGREGRGGPPRRHRPPDDRGPRRLLARGGRGRRPRVRARADGRRGPPLHPLHLGLDREAEGDPPHHRRLPDPGVRDPQARLRPQGGGGRLLVRGRRRLGDRPQLHRLRAARQRGDQRDVRGSSQLSGRGPLVGDHRALRRDDLLHGADRDPRLHEVGGRASAEARPLEPAAAGDGRRADQPEGAGSGTRRRSAAGGARSSTPGGRPRPARS